LLTPPRRLDPDAAYAASWGGAPTAAAPLRSALAVPGTGAGSGPLAAPWSTPLAGESTGLREALRPAPDSARAVDAARSAAAASLSDARARATAAWRAEEARFERAVARLGRLSPGVVMGTGTWTGIGTAVEVVDGSPEAPGGSPEAAAVAAAVAGRRRLTAELERERDEARARRRAAPAEAARRERERRTLARRAAELRAAAASERDAARRRAEAKAEAEAASPEPSEDEGGGRGADAAWGWTRGLEVALSALAQATWGTSDAVTAAKAGADAAQTVARRARAVLFALGPRVGATKARREAEAAIDRAQGQSADHPVCPNAAAAHGAQVIAGSFSTLRDGEWLDDEASGAGPRRGLPVGRPNP